MKICAFGLAKAALLGAALLALTLPLRAQPNSWISPGSGNWQDAFNWSAGPPGFLQSMFITNAGFKNVLMDNTTVLTAPATMTVSNLTVSGINNTLLMNGAGLALPLHVRREFDLRAGAILAVGASALQVDGSMKLDGTSSLFNFFSGWASVSNLVIGGVTSANCLVAVEPGASLFITNFSQSAYVDVAHGGSLTLDGGSLQTDNLILTNGGAFNDLAGTLIFNRQFRVERGGSVTISNAPVNTGFNFTLGTLTGSTGILQVLDGGSLNIFNTLGVGNNGSFTQGAGVGAVTVSNAVLAAASVSLGSTAGGVGSLSVQSNAMVNIGANFNVVSGSLSATSVVSVVDGNLVGNNVTARIGSVGSGRMEIFGGNVVLRQLVLGANNNLGFGELYMNGGFLQVLGFGDGPGAGIDSNFIWWFGGDLDGTGTSLTIGDGHDSVVMVGGSFVGHLSAVYAGVSPGKLGSWVQTGGTVDVTNRFIVGGCDNGALGSVALSGGVLYVTNAAHTAILDARNGAVTLYPGATLVVDTVVVTNSCGHVINHGGTLVMNNPPILDPNMDADNTGQSNATKLAAGLDPFDPTSVFKISGVTLTNGADTLVEWTTQGGHSYVVQAASSLNGAGFQDLSPVIPAQVPGAGTVTYLDVGGATGGPRLYRVRLGP